MEIRRLAVILACFAGPLGADDLVIKRHPLDELVPYVIRVSREEPTTCLFPGPLTALEGANVSTAATDTPPVLLSYQPGASFFSVRALKEDANAALNVIFRGKAYALTFQAAVRADRTVSFQEEPVVTPASPATPLTPEAVRSLLDRAKRHELLAKQHPLLTRTVERATPGTVTLYPGFTVTVHEVFRYGPEDALVFHATVRNTRGQPVHFDPSGVAVRVGATVRSAALTEADGVVPTEGEATLWFVITGDGQGGRANLSVHNSFFVIVPTLP
jgi:hypothetical protein